jgi:RNA polymerase sigma-70 factor (ECF subfamily)
MIERPVPVPAGDDLAMRLAAERPRLVGLCAHLSGDASMAEDLAQEALAEAWRLLAKLRQPEGLSSWLNAIARNVCLRWAREHRRDQAHTAWLMPADEAVDDVLDALPADEGEPAIALERDELIAVLDRALALLPPDTRAALVGSYVRELPQAELAARLGLSEGALRVRLHRGRLALRRVLVSDLRDEASALGLALPDDPRAAGWRTTRIWCPFCGRHALEYYLDRAGGAFWYRCAGRCYLEGMIAGGVHLPQAGGVPSPKPLLARHCLGLDRYYRDILATGHGRCHLCGGDLRIYRVSPDQPAKSLPREYGLALECPTCGSLDASYAWHLALDTPAAQRFWRRHPRMHALPVSAVEAEGRPALVSGFASADGQAQLVIVSDRQSHRVLRVHGEGETA